MVPRTPDNHDRQTECDALLFAGRRWLIDRQFLRFLAVGVLNTAFSYCFFAGLLFLGLHYAVATLISVVVGVLFNFKTTGILVFRSRDNRLILRFIGVYAVAYGVSVGCQRLCHAVGISAYLAAFVALPPTVLVIFFLCKWLVFPPARQQAADSAPAGVKP